MKKVLSLILVLVMVISAVTVVSFSTAAKIAPTGGDPVTTTDISTNPNGNVGQSASITVDGSVSDWSSSMLIAQGVANDDPRVYRDGSMHEIPIDSYALYAAWDNSNLYIMWEMKNVQDVVSPIDDFPISQGRLTIYNLPFFLVFNTGKHTAGDGTVSDGTTVWGSGLTWDDPVDTIVAFSTNFSNGPFVFTTNSSGKFVYSETKHAEIKAEFGEGVSLSTKCTGINKGHGHYNNRVPGDILDPSAAWVDFYTIGHSKSLDSVYEMAIPFTTLGIDKNYLENTGITVMNIMTFGTSGMNSLPVDMSMSDNADKPYSKDTSSSMEKEDEDHITVPLAKIGNANGIPTPPTQPDTNESEVSGNGILGDADGNNKADIADATLIQQHLASIKTLTGLSKFLANVDGDSDVTIVDATYIQQYLAGIKIKYKVNEPVGGSIPTEDTTSAYTEHVEPTTPENPDGSRTLYVDMGYTCNAHAYYWTGDSGPVAWPGTAMQNVSGTIYMINVPQGYDMIIFNNGSNQDQTADLTIPGNNYIYDKNSGSWSQYNG